MTIEVSNGRYILTARKGKVITDGGDIYAKKVILAVGRACGDFYEIPEESEELNGISQ